MKRLLLLTAALATCFPAFAPVTVLADTVGAVTVSACGTPPNTPVVGGRSGLRDRRQRPDV